MKLKLTYTVVAVLFVLSLCRLGLYVFGADPDLDREPGTARELACAACGETYPVTQDAALRLYRPGSPTNDLGEPYLACLKCGETSAILVVREVKREEP